MGRERAPPARRTIGRRQRSNACHFRVASQAFCGTFRRFFIFGVRMYRGIRVLIGIVGFLAAALPAAAADPAKVLRIAFPVQETGFDPVKVSDLYSNTVNEAIFDRLLTYDYLARPAKLVPLAAETMPEITDNGRTYVFKLRRGIYFTPNPAFKGQKRELVAEDFVYTFNRFA